MQPRVIWDPTAWASPNPRAACPQSIHVRLRMTGWPCSEHLPHFAVLITRCEMCHHHPTLQVEKVRHAGGMIAGCHSTLTGLSQNFNLTSWPQSPCFSQPPKGPLWGHKGATDGLRAMEWHEQNAVLERWCAAACHGLAGGRGVMFVSGSGDRRPLGETRSRSRQEVA